MTAICFCPEGVGAWLASDLARSGSKIGAPDKPRSQVLRLLRSRSPTSRAPTASGQNQKHPAINARLLPGGRGNLTAICFCPEGVGAWLASDLARSGSKIGAPDKPRSQVLRLLRSRSPTSRAPTASGQNQKPPAINARLLPGGRGRPACQRSASAPKAWELDCDMLLPGGRGSLACQRSGAERQQNRRTR
jgi:hypothetical protein